MLPAHYKHNRPTCTEKMSSVEVPEIDDDQVSTNTDEGHKSSQTFEAACTEDPIARLRKIEMAIRISGQRRDALTKWIETGNQNGLFILNRNPVQIPPRQLL